jgi:4-hydroxy-3-polyprenylbenzoate decarboxylase
MTAADVHVHLIISPPGRRLFAEELRVEQPDPELLAGRHADRVTAYEYEDIGCRLASGSFRTAGMVVCPCSSNTLGEIAGGLADNLIARAAQVTLKERRRLVLVPREMPVSAIDLENQLRVARAGGIICPASPGFYMQPREIDDLVKFVAGRVLDLFDVPHDWKTRWQG